MLPFGLRPHSSKPAAIPPILSVKPLVLKQGEGQSGQRHWLAVRVDNRLRSGRKSPFKQSLGDRDFQWDYSSPLGVFNQLGNWGGLYRGVTLEARESTWIDEVRVTSDLKTSKVLFELNLKSEREHAGSKFF